MINMIFSVSKVSYADVIAELLETSSNARKIVKIIVTVYQSRKHVL